MTIPTLDQIADAVINAFPKLSATEQRVSLAVYRLLAEGSPVTAAQISAVSGAGHADVLGMLAKWHGIERTQDGAVTGFWGLTLSQTKHRFRIGGRDLHTWCAWDTLFLPALLAAPADVESLCPVTGNEIALRVGPSGAESAQPKTVALSFVLPTESEIRKSVTETFCCHVHFFASPDAAGEWVSKQPRTFVLPLEAAWEIGVRRNVTQFAAVRSALWGIAAF
jgi:alkylmercury lyase